MLDSPLRRQPGSGPRRRALVHDAQDGLTINFDGDYPGGVTVVGNLVVTGHVQAGSIASINDAITALQDGLVSLQSLQAIDQATHIQSRLDTFERTVAQLVDMVGAAVIPRWATKTEVEEGDDMGLVSLSAEQLGLVIEFKIDQRNPNFSHEDVISITPTAGTLVKKGSTVVVEINLEG